MRAAGNVNDDDNAVANTLSTLLTFDFFRHCVIEWAQSRICFGQVLQFVWDAFVLLLFCVCMDVGPVSRVCVRVCRCRTWVGGSTRPTRCSVWSTGGQGAPMRRSLSACCWGSCWCETAWRKAGLCVCSVHVCCGGGGGTSKGGGRELLHGLVSGR